MVAYLQSAERRTPADATQRSPENGRANPAGRWRLLARTDKGIADMASDDSRTLPGLTAKVVSAFVGNHTVSTNDLPEVIRSVYGAFTRLTLGNSTQPTQMEAPAPAVPIRKSVTPEYIICLEDGKKMKMLKRHLMTRYGMTPDEYRTKWGLPKDYPMVAPNYAAARAETARRLGLGRRRGAGEKDI